MRILRGVRSPARLRLPAALFAACLLSAAIVPAAHFSFAARSMTVWYATDDPTEAPLVQGLADRFQSSHPGVRVQLSTYALDDMNTKLQLALSSGHAPDLIYTTPRGPGLPVYMRAGKLVDLTAAARAGGWAGSLRPGMLATYNDGISPTGNANGHIYAAPYALAAVGVLYNRSIFSRLHLSVPRSLAAFVADAEHEQAAGIIPIGMGNADGWVGDDWYLTLVNAISGPAPLLPEFRLDPHFSFAGPAFTGAATTLQTWTDRNYFTPQFGGLDAQDGVNAFFEDKTAMQLISSTENGQIAALAARTRIPIGVFGFPSARAGKPPVMAQSGFAGWAIPKAGRQPALAEQFITQMLSAATAQALLKHGLLPARALRNADLRSAPAFQRAYLQALATADVGVYLDGAPIPNLNATMEANVQLLLQKVEAPSFLVRSLQTVYASHGEHASSTRTDGEF
jgi:raffinose/stachyose/melibiose transport system substrate-binding protein